MPDMPAECGGLALVLFAGGDAAAAGFFTAGGFTPEALAAPVFAATAAFVAVPAPTVALGVGI